MPVSSSNCPPAEADPGATQQVHATCVAVDGMGVLLRGASGSGKSDLALRMIEGGARLVADDRTDLTLTGKRIVGRAPLAIKGQLEVRGLGINDLPYLNESDIGLVVDLVPAGTVERMPQAAHCDVLGVALPLIHLDPFEGSAPAKLALAVRQLLRQRDADQARPPSRPRTPRRRRVVVVTGLSGAGRSSALRVLEDLGYEAIDNPPLSLLDAIVIGDGADCPITDQPIAVGLDARSRSFATEPLLRRLDHLAAKANIESRLLFLDCEDEVLRRRYTETRRRHPLAQERPIADGIMAERRLLTPLRARAEVAIDTTALTPGRLRQVLAGHFALAEAPALAITVLSFSFRHGLPREADLVFDVRFLRNPHYDPALRPRDGRDAGVVAFIEKDPGFAVFLGQLVAMLAPLLPRYENEGKSYLTIAFGCTGGRHRSVMLTERLAAWLSDEGRQVNLVHRDIERASNGNSA